VAQLKGGGKILPSQKPSKMAFYMGKNEFFAKVAF
jgi:hypothetical protein